MAAKLKGNLVVAQSGGPTAVINASLAGVAQEGLGTGTSSRGVYGALHGIEGVLYEELIDLGKEEPRTIDPAAQDPVFGAGLLPPQVTDG